MVCITNNDNKKGPCEYTNEDLHLTQLVQVGGVTVRLLAKQNKTITHNDKRERILLLISSKLALETWPGGLEH